MVIRKNKKGTTRSREKKNDVEASLCRYPTSSQRATGTGISDNGNKVEQEIQAKRREVS
jgi:hypothetical protein